MGHEVIVEAVLHGEGGLTLVTFKWVFLCLCLLIRLHFPLPLDLGLGLGLVNSQYVSIDQANFTSESWSSLANQKRSCISCCMLRTRGSQNYAAIFSEIFLNKLSLYRDIFLQTDKPPARWMIGQTSVRRTLFKVLKVASNL